MRKSLLIERYAKALGESLAGPDVLRNTTKALSGLALFFERTPSLRNALGNPAHAMSRRRQILDLVLDNHQADQPLRNFMHALLDRNRMALLPAIAEQFDRSIDELLNTVDVRVVTVIPLAEDVRGRLVKALERLAGKTVRLRNELDPAIVAGLIVYMWGVYFDFSLRTRLERLKQLLLAEEKTQYGY
ncbi:MAG TPA: ATP synthase F1 subunit delta [Candidatus Bathyarchaeia archaeon]|nr:ATP synthase F1 subunit delta [Candidatus Bathyarchaeia archaeon]